jgi:hypothetical protein
MSDVEIDAELIHETADGILIDDGDRELWLPKRFAEYDARTGTVSLPEWLAIQEGMV